MYNSIIGDSEILLVTNYLPRLTYLSKFVERYGGRKRGGLASTPRLRRGEV